MAGAVLGASLGGVSWGQTQPMVEIDGELWPVVAMEGASPVVDLGTERRKISEGRVSIGPAAAFTDGALEVLAKDAAMGQDYGSSVGAHFFRFVADVRAERDFEDCFILFAITPEQGDASYVMREIADLPAHETHRILVTMPVNPGFGGGKFFYLVFSQGEEIQLIDRQELSSIRREEEPPAPAEERVGAREAGETAPVSRSRGDLRARPAKAITAVMPDFPKSLVGVVQGGYAEAIFSIGENGRAMELLDVSADRIEFLPEMMRAVVGSRYRPGTLDGKAVVATVRQKFFFNEFATFPEEMESIAYPKLDDRAATAIYAPLPRNATGAKGEVRIEILVDTLGRPQEPRVLSAPSEEMGAATLEAARRWLFLPGVKDGFPQAQLVVVPVAFKP